VRTKAVVVLGIGPKDVLEMACIDDEQMIEALRSNGPDEALGVGIGVRRTEWGLEDLGTFRPKDLVEVRHVLRVTWRLSIAISWRSASSSIFLASSERARRTMNSNTRRTERYAKAHS
jgi:hypothetical protein